MLSLEWVLGRFYENMSGFWKRRGRQAGGLPSPLSFPTPGPQDMLEFPAQELRKYFKMGDHVKVIAGRFEGDTGLIVRVEENFVILFSDLTMHEVGGGRGSSVECARRRPRLRSYWDPASPLSCFP